MTAAPNPKQATIKANTLTLELPENWTIGQRADVFIETGGGGDALREPPRLLRGREGKSDVFVGDCVKETMHDVTLGLRGGQTMEVTQGGSVGEKVVPPADPKRPPLKPGQDVTAE